MVVMHLQWWALLFVESKTRAFFLNLTLGLFTSLLYRVKYIFLGVAVKRLIKSAKQNKGTTILLVKFIFGTNFYW